MTLITTMIVVFCTSSLDGNVVLSSSARVFLMNSPTPSLCFFSNVSTASDTGFSPIHDEPILIKNYLAGVPGLEPGPKVLETSMLTIDTIPLYGMPAVAGSHDYLFSLLSVWQWQRRQYFFNSNRFGVFFLFFFVT